MKSEGQEIIEKILDVLDVKAPTFASNIGVAYQRIYDIQRGKTKRISTELGNKIISIYPQLNLSWLLSGEGDMLNDENQQTSQILNKSDSNYLEIIQSQQRTIDTLSQTIASQQRMIEDMYSKKGTADTA